MNDCNTCRTRKDCGILIQEKFTTRWKYKNGCTCRKCIIKANCSQRCDARVQFVQKMINELSERMKRR